ncbi:MAG: YqeG family HAD IIIA-type phosphatase [Leptolyngbyaceae cyanobacterium bins.349]|nr:YqeG family HAD IIIA-type phosphatase [Leptolyngbyaceae cyanobacterium bins.349]
MFSHIVSFFKQSPPRARSLPSDSAKYVQNGRAVQKLPSKAVTLAFIDIDSLLQSQVRGVILDLDNTVVSEDDRYLCPHAEKWIEAAKHAGLKFYILSNGKRRYRVRYWSARLDMPAINPARKPFPFAFRQAFKHMQLKPEQVVVIGDSFHTDVLGALWNGCRSIQVASLPHKPRWWERLLGRYIQTPYPAEFELWNFDPSSYSN